MKSLCLTLLVVGALTGCSETSTKSPDVSDGIRKSLDQARLTDVSVSQDRDKGVVTLGGHVAADADKAQAESIAKSLAAGQPGSRAAGQPGRLLRTRSRCVLPVSSGMPRR